MQIGPNGTALAPDGSTITPPTTTSTFNDVKLAKHAAEKSNTTSALPSDQISSSAPPNSISGPASLHAAAEAHYAAGSAGAVLDAPAIPKPAPVDNAPKMPAYRLPPEPQLPPPPVPDLPPAVSWGARAAGTAAVPALVLSVQSPAGEPPSELRHFQLGDSYKNYIFRVANQPGADAATITNAAVTSWQKLGPAYAQDGAGQTQQSDWAATRSATLKAVAAAHPGDTRLYNAVSIAMPETANAAYKYKTSPAREMIAQGVFRTRVDVQTENCTQRSSADVEKLRQQDFPGPKKAWLQKIASDPTTVRQLKAHGFTDKEIDEMKRTGKAPEPWEVHHRIPLQCDNGKNLNVGSNFVLVRNKVTPSQLASGQTQSDHRLFTNAQIAEMREMGKGKTPFEMPVPPAGQVIWENP